jgi:hypothetical protein
MRSARSCFLSDLGLHDAAAPGLFVRITAWIRYVNVETRICEVEDEGMNLIIDGALADLTGCSVGSLVQFVGEIVSIDHSDPVRIY